MTAKRAGDLNLRRAANVGIAGEDDIGRLARLVASNDVGALVDRVSRLVRARVAVWRCLEVCRAVGLRELCANFSKTLSIISGPICAPLPHCLLLALSLV